MKNGLTLTECTRACTKNTLQNDLCLLHAIDNSLTTSQRTACVSLSAVPLSLRKQDVTGSEFQNQLLYHYIPEKRDDDKALHAPMPG